MTERHSLADRLRARLRQRGLNATELARAAGVNRSFVHDILRERSTRPGRETLGRVAQVLGVETDWLIHGVGAVEGPPPLVENHDDAFVPIARAGARPSMGGGAVADDQADAPGPAFQFRRSWIRNELKTSPSQLRILQVEGDSMEPTLMSGDSVLVDLTRRAPHPPGVFVLDDGMGLVAKRIEPIPGSDPPALRILSDNPRYPPYDRTADEVHIVGRIRWFAREV